MKHTKWKTLAFGALSLAVGCLHADAGPTSAKARDIPFPSEVPADVPASSRTFQACVKAGKGDAPPTSPLGARSLRLQILVVSADDVGTSMVKAGLTEGLVPCTEVDLRDPERPVIDATFLADGMHARYQAVVLPSEAPAGLAQSELDALASYERAFGIRQLSSYVYPSVAVGLRPPVEPGYDGPFDGMLAQLTAPAKAGPFAYLNGELRFDDLDPKVVESSGYLSLPLPDDDAQRRTFTPLVTLAIPGAPDTRGVMLGVYEDAGREQLVMTAAMNAYQLQQQALFPGILEWLTRGVHLGTERSYFSVHIDDIFLPNARWSTREHCTISSRCDAGNPSPQIDLSAADVDYLERWQTEHRIQLDLMFNGSGYDREVARGAFPAGERLLQRRAAFRWVSHTYNHLYLGCAEDLKSSPVRCITDASGALRWASYSDIYAQIADNQDFARRRGLAIASDELVTGEHSGLRRAPQEPSDNPNLARALAATGIAWVASDASRETGQRGIGGALTTPRYPMNVFYDAATRAETVDEYNFIYTSAADGGSGACETDPLSTCIAPLALGSGFDDYIVPSAAHGMLLHALSNSPRAHFAHQSNLADERVLYPVLERVLRDYRQVFATSADVVNASLTELGRELQRQMGWIDAREHVSAYIADGQLQIQTDQDGVVVPLTLPVGSAQGGTLVPYAGHLTGWREVGAAGASIRLPDTQ